MIAILDYDDFGIYSAKEDIKLYIESLLLNGFEEQSEIYDMCLEKFGENSTDEIDELFNED